MKQNPKSTGVLKKVLCCLAPHRWAVLGSLLLAVCNVALTLYIPIRIGNAIDYIVGIGQVELAAVLRILTEIGGLVALGALLQWCMTYLNQHITYRIVEELRNRGFARMVHLPLSYLDGRPTGETLNRMISDVDQLADGLLLGFTQLFTGIMTILGTLAFMLAMDIKITLVVVVLTPLSLFIAKFIATKTHAMFQTQASVRAEQTSLIDEGIGQQRVVQAFSREEAFAERFDQVNERLGRASLRAVFFSSLTNPTTRFVNSVVYAAVALTGAFTCIATAGTATPFTVGMLSALLAYANQYTKPFNEISGVVTEFQNALVCASRIFALIEEPCEEELPRLAEPFVAKGDVTLSDVCFSYVPNRPLIEGLCLQVKAGQRIAIVGPTGCGKTTLINLLMRFYDVNEGVISVDDTPIDSLSRHDLRRNYGMVLQDTWLKCDTVAANIALGHPNATMEQIVHAAKEAHADSFIRRLPQGYDTVIGEGGGNLSAGQKQLISIARIMLSSPPMLILDEATSSIDTRTEIRIQKAFAVLMEGRTSFIVAHRLSTIREADLILVMKEGNIIEQGTHEALLARKGFYHHLYFSGFAGAAEE